MHVNYWVILHYLDSVGVEGGLTISLIDKSMYFRNGEEKAFVKKYHFSIGLINKCIDLYAM